MDKTGSDSTKEVDPVNSNDCTQCNVQLDIDLVRAETTEEASYSGKPTLRQKGT